MKWAKQLPLNISKFSNNRQEQIIFTYVKMDIKKATHL